MLSLGAALFASIVTFNADAARAWNPFYAGSAIGYSNAFGVLALGVVLALALVARLPTKTMVAAEKAEEAKEDNWTPDCAVPWCPELQGSSVTSTD